MISSIVWYEFWHKPYETDRLFVSRLLSWLILHPKGMWECQLAMWQRKKHFRLCPIGLKPNVYRANERIAGQLFSNLKHALRAILFENQSSNLHRCRCESCLTRLFWKCNYEYDYNHKFHSILAEWVPNLERNTTDSSYNTNYLKK